MRPDILRLDRKTLEGRQAIEPDICQPVYLGLDARHKAAAQTYGTVEFSGVPEHADASRIQCGCDIVATGYLDKSPVPADRDRATTLSIGVHSLSARGTRKALTVSSYRAIIPQGFGRV
jgi:hypothetical protein